MLFYIIFAIYWNQLILLPFFWNLADICQRYGFMAASCGFWLTTVAWAKFCHIAIWLTVGIPARYSTITITQLRQFIKRIRQYNNNNSKSCQGLRKEHKQFLILSFIYNKYYLTYLNRLDFDCLLKFGLQELNIRL